MTVGHKVRPNRTGSNSSRHPERSRRTSAMDVPPRSFDKLSRLTIVLCHSERSEESPCEAGVHCERTRFARGSFAPLRMTALDNQR
jgi:hypothetical protein